MTDTPFIKFYPSDFLGGTSGLSPAERGVYITLLCLIYENDGPIPRDDARLSRRCGAPKAAFRKIIEALLEQGKLQEIDGLLTNSRAEKSLMDRTKRTQNGTHAAHQRWTAQKQKSKQNQAPKNASAMPQQCAEDASQKPELEEKGDTNVSPKNGSDQAPPAPQPANEQSEAVGIFNEAASRHGWPQVQKMNQPRISAISARLKECGGIEGWRHAIERAEASDLLSGRKNDWNVTFDWLTKPRNFIKVMEGNYDDNKQSPARKPDRKPPSTHQQRMQRIIEAAARGSTG